MGQMVPQMMLLTSWSTFLANFSLSEWISHCFLYQQLQFFQILSKFRICPIFLDIWDKGGATNDTHYSLKHFFWLIFHCQNKLYILFVPLPFDMIHFLLMAGYHCRVCHIAKSLTFDTLGNPLSPSFWPPKFYQV